MMKENNNLKNKKYTCLKCGECCGAWNLPVEKEVYEKLINNGFVKTLLEKEAVKFEYKNDQYNLPKKEGLCIFLDQSDKICLLQSQIGIDFKPLECQRFPFAFVKDQNGTLYYDTSFYCKAILQNEGEEINFLSNIDSLSKFDIFNLPEKILLKPDKEITFSDGEKIIDTINQQIITHCSNRSIYEWLEILIAVLKDIDTLKKPDHESINISIPLKQNKTLNKIKKHLLKTILLRKNNLYSDLPKIILNILIIKDPLIGEEVKLKHIKTIKLNNNEEIKNTILRYLLDILSRKALYAHGHSITGKIIVMITAYTLIEWYAKILAYCENLKTAEMFHVETAIRIVERYYIGHNVKFMERFRNKNSLNFFKSVLLFMS